MKRTHKISARKLVKSSIDFISLRLVTVNSLCRELPASSKNQTGKKLWDREATKLSRHERLKEGWGRELMPTCRETLLRVSERRGCFSGDTEHRHAADAVRGGGGGAGTSHARRSRLRVPRRLQNPSSWRGWHRHAFPTQKPSQAPGLRCPLLALEGFSRLALFSLCLTSLFLRPCVGGGRGAAVGLRSPSRCRLAVVLAVAGWQKLMIDVEAESKQLLIWLLLFHLLTFRSIMGIFIHFVTLNGIWCSTSPGTMKEWYCAEVV